MRISAKPCQASNLDSINELSTWVRQSFVRSFMHNEKWILECNFSVFGQLEKKSMGVRLTWNGCYNTILSMGALYGKSYCD